jgi:peroxiredoxin
MRRIIPFAAAMLLSLSSLAGAAEAPDFELEDINGDEIAMSDLLDNNKLVVIDFWEVGCKPCNELLPHLQDYYDEYGGDGVEVVIISRDTSLTQAQVEPYFKSKDYSFKVLLDGDREVAQGFGVTACPYTFIVQPDGKIIYSHYGYKPGQEDEIKETIDKALAGEEMDEVEAGDPDAEAEDAEAAEDTANTEG